MSEEQIPYGQEYEASALCRYIDDIFQNFKSARAPWDDVAEECWRNYMGEYQSSTIWNKKEGEGRRSRIFVKVTQLKCNTAHAKIMDALGPNPPFSVNSYGDTVKQVDKYVVEEVVRQKKKFIEDYLKKIKFRDVLSNGVLDATIYPLFILKGPILTSRPKTKIIPRTFRGMPISAIDKSVEPFEVVTEYEDVWVIDHIPYWEYYGDPNVGENKKSIGEIHYQRLLPAEVRALANTTGYNKEAVLRAAESASTSYDTSSDHKDVQQGDQYAGEQGEKDKRVPIVEYWGLVPVKMLREYEVEVPKDYSDDDDAEAVVVKSENNIFKAEFNYIGRRPFKKAQFRKRPHTLYGDSVAMLMRDSQKIINSAMRLMIDNKALSGSGMVVWNTHKLDLHRMAKSGENPGDIYPNKGIFTKAGVDAREAVQQLTFQDVTAGLRELVEFGMRFADEETAIPKFTHGEQDTFLNKTATGISMLMNASNVNLKSFMRNIDDQIIEPIIEDLDHIFSITGEYPPGLRLPIKITAEGSMSLVAKEIMVENLMRALQIISNPMYAGVANANKAVELIMKHLDLGELVNSPEEQAQIKEAISKKQDNMQEFVDIDKLFPMLSPMEQAQILMSIGIQPDQRRFKGVIPYGAGANIQGESAPQIERA